MKSSRGKVKQGDLYAETSLSFRVLWLFVEIDVVVSGTGGETMGAGLSGGVAGCGVGDGEGLLWLLSAEQKQQKRVLKRQLTQAQILWQRLRRQFPQFCSAFTGT
jgi:hypothetical protein